jgi:hypothetical protein
MADKKTCRYCITEIDARARVCPNCRQWLSGKVWRIGLPIGVLLAMFAAVAWVECTLGKKLGTPGEEFAKHVDDFRLSDCELKFGQEACQGGQREVVAVVGTLQNDGDLPWEDITLAAAFFDKAGGIVDAMQHYERLPIAPHGTMPFKISGTRQFPKEQYASYKVQVAMARHVRWPF